MNFEAWQAQQKAQKDEERRKKTQAAEALRNYRSEGLSEGETKLSALREQERKKKEEAERQLREYRGTLSEEEAKLAAMKEEELRKKQEAENELRNLDLHSSTGTMNKDFQQIAPGAVSSMAGRFSGTFSASDLEGIQAAGAGSTTVPPGETVSNGDAPVAESAPPFDTIVESIPTTQPPAVDAFPVSQPEILPPVPLNYTASFYFGLISLEPSPILEGYMAQIDEISKNTMAQSGADAVFQGSEIVSVTNDAMFLDSAGRSEVTRRLVTVSVRYKVGDNHSGKDLEQRIIGTVRDAVQSGTFCRR